MSLDVAALRNAEVGDLVQLYMRMRDHREDADITESLLQAIHDESLPPTMFSIWLTVSQSDKALAHAIHQPYSCLVRKFAIKQLGRRMRTSCWESVWKEFGGTEGVLVLFAQLSVADIGHITKVIGHCNKGQPRPARETCIEALLSALVPFYHTEGHLKTTDLRPLLHYYARMAPACSSRFVERILDQPENPLLPHLKPAQISKHHPEIVQQCVFEVLSSSCGNEKSELLLPCLPQLTRQVPSGPRDSSGFSPTMSFTLDVLIKLAQGTSVGLTAHTAMMDVAGPLLHRATRNKVEIGRVLEIVNATLQYVERVPEAAQYLSASTHGFLYILARYWSMRRTDADDKVDGTFTSCLRLCGDGKTQSAVEDMMKKIILVVAKKHRYTFLQLLFKHCQRPSVDIDDVDQLRRLSFTTWPCQTFVDMEYSDAIQLLHRLVRAKRDSGFLELDWFNNSIFSHPGVPGGEYADPGVLGTYLNRGQPDALPQAEQGIPRSSGLELSSHY